MLFLLTEIRGMKDLSVGNERKLIWQFAMPMLLGNVFQQLYNIVDSIIVGNYIGKEALAAVGASFPFLFTLISLVIGIAVGATIIIAQYFGAKDIRNVRKTIDTLFIMMFFASIVIAVAGIALSEPIFRLIQLPDEVLPIAEEYFDVYMLGCVFFFGFNSITAVLRGLGDSRTPLYFLVISTVLNIALDLLFVLGLNWGVKGVALATIIAQAIAFFLAVIYLNRTHEIVNLGWRKFDFDRGIMDRSLKIGFPVGFQQAFVALSMLAMYWLVNRFGTDATAAYSVVFRIDSFASMPAMNFAMALSTFVGQNLGARKPERVRRGLLSTFYMTAVISLSISLACILFAEPLMRWFTKDATVIDIGTGYIYIVTGFYIVFSTMFVVGGVMRGAGDTFIPMLITFFALWVVRIPAGYYLSENYGYLGIWWAIPIAWVIGLTLSFSYYSTGRWRRKVVIKHKTDHD